MAVLSEQEVDEIERRLKAIIPPRDWHWIGSQRGQKARITDTAETIATLECKETAAVAEFIVEAKNNDIPDLIETVRELRRALDRAHDNKVK